MPKPAPTSTPRLLYVALIASKSTNDNLDLCDWGVPNIVESTPISIKPQTHILTREARRKLARLTDITC